MATRIGRYIFEDDLEKMDIENSRFYRKVAVTSLKRSTARKFIARLQKSIRGRMLTVLISV